MGNQRPKQIERLKEERGISARAPSATSSEVGVVDGWVGSEYLAAPTLMDS